MSPATPLEPDPCGQSLGRYRLLSRLGMGGMGTVYEAEHRMLQKRVAIKLMRGQPGPGNARKRFIREAKTISRIEHPNVVNISDLGMTRDGKIYFVMERLLGRDLSELLERETRLSWTRARRVFLQITSALEAAHAQGIIHRDIKPSNCFLVDIPGLDGLELVKVLDFGIAKSSTGDAEELTSTGELLGTAAYMAPEVVTKGTYDQRSDVYAVGVMLYRTMVGELPFRGNDAIQVLSHHVRSPPVAPREKQPSVPRPVEAIILKALEKNPARRYQSMRALGRALRSVPPASPTEDTETKAWEPMKLAARGHTSRRPMLLSFVMTLLLGTGTIGSVIASRAEHGAVASTPSSALAPPTMPTPSAAEEPPPLDARTLHVASPPISPAPTPPRTDHPPPRSTTLPHEPDRQPTRPRAKTPRPTESTHRGEDEPPSDSRVIASMRRRIRSRCTEGGNTTIAIEGMISTKGKVLSPSVEPPTSAASRCAKTVVQSTHFAPGALMRPLPRVLLKL